MHGKESNMRRAFRSLVILGLGVMLCGVGIGQQAAKTNSTPQAGDDPADPGPLAADLSPALRSKQIRTAMRRVADWELARVEAQPPSRSWDFGALDIGLVAASRTLHDPRYSQYVTSVGDRFGWKLERTVSPASDFALAQAFIEMYRSSHDESQMAASRRQFDDAISSLDPQKPVFWWADALFMAPPTGVALSDITSDPTYNAYVNRQWGYTEKLLFDHEAHLFSRDAADIGRHEKNGQKVFLARSNGLAMAGLARVLMNLPSDDPLHQHYVDLLRQMAEAVAAVQGSDGLWRPGLLDAADYPLPNVAGSAFITYALAWGIGHRVLDADKYLPVVEKALGGMLSHIYADGRLGSMAPMGDVVEYGPGSSYNFGVGGFLLAASELDALSDRKHW
jgi:unsaturated rhamnogalacturonyl hydrolase